MTAGKAPRRRRPEPTAEPPGPNQALETAARFLATRPRSRWEVGRRLERAGATDAVREQVLERLAELGLVDDLAFARWWREQRDRHAPRGQRMLAAELRAKGVPRDVIQALGDVEPAWAPEEQGLPLSEADRARDALAGHLRGRPLPTERGALQRLGTYLMRRGFDADTARAAIRAAGAKTGDDVP